jgi:chromosome segregation ATPase
MPICSKCGSYFSEVSCPNCTPDDSPKSPVTTVHVEEKNSIRIIDPIELLDSIEKAEMDLAKLEDEKSAEIKKLESQIKELGVKEQEIQSEMDLLLSQVPELQLSIKEKNKEKANVLSENQILLEETNSLKARVLTMETKKMSIETKLKELRENIGAE